MQRRPWSPPPPPPLAVAAGAALGPGLPEQAGRAAVCRSRPAAPPTSSPASSPSRWARRWARRVIVENKAGGGGSIGATETARAAPDGYTLGMATVSTTAANPAINPKIAVQPDHRLHADHQHRGHAERDRGAPELPGQGLQGLRRRAEEEPGQVLVRVARAPAASATCRWSCTRACPGTFVTHIPYRGAGPALNDTVAGQVPMIFDNLPSALPFIKDGRLVADRGGRAAAPGGAAERADLQGSRPGAGEPHGLLRHPRAQGPAARTWSTRSTPRSRRRWKTRRCEAHRGHRLARSSPTRPSSSPRRSRPSSRSTRRSWRRRS